MLVVELKEPLPAPLPGRIEVEEEPRRGGAGAVFFSRDGGYAVKVYPQPRPDQETLLRHLIETFRALPPDQERLLAPPLALIETLGGRRHVGFVMRRVPPDYRALPDFIVNAREAARQLRQGRGWDDFLRVARCVAGGVAALHAKNIIHGRIEPHRFLASLQGGEAVLLGLDGMAVAGVKTAEAEFLAPEIVRAGVPPDTRTDCHSLAVLILHTLLFRNVMLPPLEVDADPNRSDAPVYGEYALFSEHPGNRQRRPRNLGRPLFDAGCLSYKMLPPRLQRLAERALIAGRDAPQARPAPPLWEEALAATLDELWTCGACGQRFPYPYWQAQPEIRACPFCGEPAGRHALLLELFEEGRPGSFRSIERRLVLGEGSPVYADAAEPGGWPPSPGRERHVLGRVGWEGSGFYLVNEGQARWSARSLSGEPGVTADRGQSVPLQPGYCIHFGPGRRLALVAG